MKEAVMREIDKTKPVLVTGGSGYIASWIIKMLLEDGIDVHATVRDPSNAEKVNHLKEPAKNAADKRPYTEVCNQKYRFPY
jgi:nucleoside-diphosphate-sugar epimerase